MKYFPAAGRYRSDAVAIVAGCGPYLDFCEPKKTFFFLPPFNKNGIAGTHVESFTGGCKTAAVSG